MLTQLNIVVGRNEHIKNLTAEMLRLAQQNIELQVNTELQTQIYIY